MFLVELMEEDLIFDRVDPEYIISWEKGDILNGL